MLAHCRCGEATDCHAPSCEALLVLVPVLIEVETKPGERSVGDQSRRDDEAKQGVLAPQPLEIADLSSWLNDSFLLWPGSSSRPTTNSPLTSAPSIRHRTRSALPTSFASNASKWSSSRWSSAMPERKRQM